jgi:predicted  nucleic acid-binding Zn-ribbon protein
MASLRQLYELQELDWTISNREKALSEVRAKLADDAAVAAAMRRLQQLQSQFERSSAQRRDTQLSVQQRQERLKGVDDLLYGGTIKNPRELSAYQQERDILQRQLKEAEDRLLEAMVETEEIETSRDEARQQFAGLESQRAAQNADLLKEQERLEGALGELRQARNGLAPQIPPSELSVYESLLKTRGGHAVAKVERARGICQGCRIAVPASELQRARSSQGLVQCGSCRRILYVV